MDAKFYDVNYGGLHQEMGVKTKPRKRAGLLYGGNRTLVRFGPDIGF
jgi:hypothetical protein